MLICFFTFTETAYDEKLYLDGNRYTIRFKRLPTQNVGIGTTTPSEKTVHVNGEYQYNGTIKAMEDGTKTANQVLMKTIAAKWYGEICEYKICIPIIQPGSGTWTKCRLA